MFTGIVQDVAPILELAPAPGGALRLRLRTRWKDLEIGESVALNGACLTVETPEPGAPLSSGEVSFFASPETLERTQLSSLGVGSRVNLERAVTLQTRLSGHLVQGHVDAVARLASAEPRGDSWLLRFEIPSRQARHCVEKGSITLQGVSLTINALRDGQASATVEVMVIPHTWNGTNLSDLKPGDPVNLETDFIAKHLERLCQPYATPSTT